MPLECSPLYFKFEKYRSYYTRLPPKRTAFFAKKPRFLPQKRKTARLRMACSRAVP
ncbi:hypothetical protein HMPREF9436_00519 [Faecalibacterium cf. prausnitzii KLE1255]|uniref:Uncharacterized protein n=1 Tax=Faecalibacterium cf. prausnitzii KLE1255 TaxID=748224 RepID=E2ZFT5_9FIRM|nr:hypothetical protein HMPREF9436_00519 [Faecalibacterium cf. prausnitzii KLE1255]